MMMAAGWGLVAKADSATEFPQELLAQIRSGSWGVFWIASIQPLKFNYVSAAARILTGRDPGEFCLNAEAWFQAIHPDDRRRVREAFGNLQLLEAFDEEYRMVSKEGSERWVRDRAIPVRKDDGSLRAVGFAEDITGRRISDRLVREIATGVSAQTGEGFLRSLVVHMVRMLRVQYTFVGEVVGEERESVKTVAAAVSGEIAPNFEYKLRDTPSADVISRATCIYPAGVQALFPNDRLLSEMSVQSFAGTRLNGSDGSVLGLLVVLDTKPWVDFSLARSVLQIFASRAAAELERRRAEASLRESNALLQGVIEGTSGIVLAKDLNGRYRLINSAGARALGRPANEILGHTDAELLPEPMAERRSAADKHVIETGRRFVIEEQARLEHEDRVFLTTKEPWRNAKNDVTGVIAVGTDITARKRLEEQLEHNAFHDSLTGLANRVLFLNRLDWALKRIRRHPNEIAGVMFLDLDRFKIVNDALGHEAGDQILIVVAQRLQQCVRDDDTVARLGGDEFALLVEGMRDVNGVVELAERILASLRPPVPASGRDILTSVSIGIALASGPERTAAQVLQDADIAMFRAKERGRGCYQVFDEAMHRRALDRLELETELHRAAERKELELYFQRIVNLDTQKAVGLEALLRWRHSQRGLVPAAAFIPLAEESGLIIPIGWWAIEEACRLVSRWRIANRIDPRMYVSINLSGRQFAQADLVEKMADVLARTGAAPNLSIEITETVIMEQDEGAVARRLERLRQLGVALMIDDFGTGHSSLSRLHEFPIDTLKIDRSFVARLRNGGGPEVCRAIVALATNMDMDVVAEGIEDAGQVATLRDLGCQLGQGFYFSRPMDALATERSLTPQA